MQWIKEMFSDSKGQVSSLRMIHFFTYMMYMTVWCFLSIKHGEIISVSNDWLAILGGLQIGKVYQKKIEDNK